MCLFGAHTRPCGSSEVCTIEAEMTSWISGGMSKTEGMFGLLEGVVVDKAHLPRRWQDNANNVQCGIGVRRCYQSVYVSSSLIPHWTVSSAAANIGWRRRQRPKENVNNYCCCCSECIILLRVLLTFHSLYCLPAASLRQSLPAGACGRLGFGTYH